MPGELLSCRLSFGSTTRAADISLYNAVLLWLLAILHKANFDHAHLSTLLLECARRAAAGNNPNSRQYPAPNRLLGRPVFADHFAPLLPPAASVALRDYALEILLVLDWQSRHHPKAATQLAESIYMYLVPSAMTMSMLDDDDDPVQPWIRQMLDNHPVTAGYWDQRGYMQGFSRFVTRDMIYPDA